MFEDLKVPYLKPNKPEVQYSPDLKFIKEYEEYHVPNRLYVHWDITTNCNFDCSYCYAKREYGNDWHKTDEFRNQELVIKALKMRKYPLFLGFLGGEPTLHPRFLELLDLAHHELITGELDRLYVTTNGSTNLISKIPEYDKMYMLWSVHLEHKDKYGKNFSKLFNNIKISINKKFINRVNILLIPDEKYYDDYSFIFSTLKKLNVQIHPHFLYDNENDKRKLYQYSGEFFDILKILDDTPKNYIFETDNKYVRLNDFDIFKYKLNSFKNWNCYNNNFEINYIGEVQSLCQRERAL